MNHLETIPPKATEKLSSAKLVLGAKKNWDCCLSVLKNYLIAEILSFVFWYRYIKDLSA